MKRGKAGAQFVFSTSGSTGAPKLVVFDESRLIANAARVVQYLELDRADRTLCVFPIYLMFGVSTLLCSLLSNGYIELINSSSPALITTAVIAGEFNVLPIIGDWGIELARQCSSVSRKLPPLMVLNASDRLLRIQAEHLLPVAKRLWNNYGQTESGPRILALELTGSKSLSDLCVDDVIAPGRSIDPRINLQISRSLDDRCDNVGELRYISPFSMMGYLRSDGQVAKAPDWIDSGDLFKRNDDGLYFWIGRLAQSIKYNGEFLPINGVVNRLLSDGSVLDAAFRKTERGELVLFVVPNSNAVSGEERISRVLSGALRGVKCRIEFSPQLLRTESGKVSREQRRSPQERATPDAR